MEQEQEVYGESLEGDVESAVSLVRDLEEGERVFSPEAAEYISREAIRREETIKTEKEEKELVKKQEERISSANEQLEHLVETRQEGITSSALYTSLGEVGVSEKAIDSIVSEYDKGIRDEITKLEEQLEFNNSVIKTYKEIVGGVLSFLKGTELTLKFLIKNILNGATGIYFLPTSFRRAVEFYSKDTELYYYYKKLKESGDEARISEANELDNKRDIKTSLTLVISGTSGIIGGIAQPFLIMDYGWKAVVPLAVVNVASGVYELVRHKVSNRRARKRLSKLERESLERKLVKG